MYEYIAETWAKVFIVLLCLYCIIQIAEFIRAKRQAHLVMASRQAIKTYVKTGSKTATFHSLGGSLIETAERLRSDYIEEERRSEENKQIDTGFQLFCNCPRCSSFDMHHMSGNASGRQCKSCGYTWHVPF